MPNENNLKPFEKGKTGNPNGRPVGSRSRSTIAKKWLDTVTEWVNPITGETEMLSLEDQITLAQIKTARDKRNKTPAYKALLDAKYGSLQQYFDITTDGEKLQPTATGLTNEEMLLAIELSKKMNGNS